MDSIANSIDLTNILLLFFMIGLGFEIKTLHKEIKKINQQLERFGERWIDINYDEIQKKSTLYRD